jgi:hypothetical protein
MTSAKAHEMIKQTIRFGNGKTHSSAVKYVRGNSDGTSSSSPGRSSTLLPSRLHVLESTAVDSAHSRIVFGETQQFVKFDSPLWWDVRHREFVSEP